MSFLNLFNSKHDKKVVELNDERKQLNNLVESLHLSFDQLQETSKDVTQSATNATDFIKKELKKSQYRFFSVIDSIDDIVIVKNNLDQWITVNSFTRKLLNIQFGDFYLKTDEEIIEFLNGQSPNIKYIANSDKAWDEKTPIHETYSLLNNECEKHYFNIVKTPTFCNKEKTVKKELIIIGRDVTTVVNERKEHALLANVINKASDIILVISGDGLIHFANDAFLKVFKYESLDELKENPVSMLRSGTHDEQFFKDLWDTISSNQIWTGTIINSTKNGDFIECNTTIIPVMNGKTKPINYISLMKVINGQATD